MIKKSGINQPLICKRCGKKIGTIKIKPRLYWKIIFWALIIALLLQFITEVLANYGASFLKLDWCC